MDEDNIIPDVEVVMRDFYMNIDLEVEFLEKRLSKHRDNESDDDIEELDVIDNDQWDSLDEGSDTYWKMRAVIKELGKEIRCSQGEIHKIMDQIESNLTIPVRALQESLQKEYQVGFFIHKSTNPDIIVNLEFDSEPNPSRAVSNMLLNNICEVFNSKLIEGRDKPLITCLEYIREYMMKRICLNDKANNGEKVRVLHTYAHRMHWLETWKATYVYKVELIKGQAMCPMSECPIKITPPLHHNQPRRTKKKRKQSIEEKSQMKGDNGASGGGSQIHVANRSGKLTRKFIKVTCRKCKNKGHNARTCKVQGGN
ncbi:unnamed protein product [Lactuca saligna]|uniref:CCHC-type domain-containing protein n=1 Tax=Lactuca saligna TaxID=75948 RepID=A0AA36EP70_LACSI|nr:unnamed protein product [Lactuca saligna]